MKVTAEAARRFLVERHLLAPARSLEGGPGSTLVGSPSAVVKTATGAMAEVARVGSRLVALRDETRETGP